MSDEWYTLTQARGQIIAARRCDREEAQQELESDLAENRRQSTGFRVAIPKGKNADASASAGQVREEIPRAWWNKTAGSSYVSDVIAYYEANELWSNWGAKYIDVLVSDPIQQKTKNNGGRPAEYNWEEFQVEIVRLANTPDGLPTRAQLTKHLKDWCSANWLKEPPDSLLREHIALVAHLCRK